MKKTLKEVFGLREMAINVPDKDVPALAKAISAAIKQGSLPPDAAAWVPQTGGAQPAANAGSKTKLPPPGSKPSPSVLKPPATTSKTPSSWAAHKSSNPGQMPTAPAAKPAAATPPPIPGKKTAGPSIKARNGDEEEFPSFAANKQEPIDVATDDDYKSPFAGLGMGTKGSSWDNIPAWARDPEQMPRADRDGSGRIPSSGDPLDDADFEKPGKLAKPQKKKGLASLSPVGAQWTDKDVKKATKKPGMLSRIFGKKSEN